MIEASFHRNAERSALVSGAYQYDTGQRLRMHGLPSPQELAQEDEFLSGDMVTVQVHFGFKGETQTEARLALWDEDEGCYLAAIPDAYLQRDESVYAYVYVSHGVDEDGNGRTKTMYELTFRPISRPAPNNMVTAEQITAWAAKADEMDLALDALDTAAGGLQTKSENAAFAAQSAEKAAQNAEDAQETADDAAALLAAQEKRWSSMIVKTTVLAAGASATAALSGNVLTYGIPKGAAGAKGKTGDTGPADISLSISGGVLTITKK